jgi:hypothetical protein
MHWSSGWMMPAASTILRVCTPSPAMLPSAHTACSRTSGSGDANSFTKEGTAFALITAFVFSDVPEAILVSVQHASNCRRGYASYCSSDTTRGTTPAWITASIGGARSARAGCGGVGEGRGGG